MWAAKGLGRKLRWLATVSSLPVRRWRSSTPRLPIHGVFTCITPLAFCNVLLRHGATLWGLVRGDPKTRTAAEHTNEVTALREWLMSG